MIPKIEYITLHYLFAFLFVFASWGIGSLIISRFTSKKEENSSLEHTLGAALGIGVYICLVQWLAIAGLLRFSWIIAIVFIGLVASIFQIRTTKIPSLKSLHIYWRSLSYSERGGLLVVMLFVISTLLGPLQLPLESDEVSYHLPHAQQWALTGRLGVNNWLRYPWFPYNFDLLYSAALIAYDDVFAHMLHAIAGWLTGLIIYSAGKKYLSHGAACLGVVIWIDLVRNQFGNAFVDMGLSLFIFSACVSLYVWLESNQKPWLFLATFFMGVAIGIKYQALGFLPIFAFAIIIRERKLKPILGAAFFMLIPCGYWYIRNIIFTGDPFNPLGGKIFGFSDWNLGDFKYQFEDLQRVSDWPKWILWPAAVALFTTTQMRCRNFVRASVIFCGISFIVWLMSSHYTRYLMPAYPLLALLAGCSWLWLLSKGINLIDSSSIAQRSPLVLYRIKSIACVLILIILTSSVIIKSVKFWKAIAPTEETREAKLQKYVKGYKALSFLRKNQIGPTYQFGLYEGIYYGPPTPIWGDVFGPGRYRDFVDLNSEQLALKLKLFGINTIIVDTNSMPQISSKSNFKKYFAEIYESDGVKVFKVL